MVLSQGAPGPGCLVNSHRKGFSVSEDISPLLTTSDKTFWHGYLDFYERHLPATLAGTIVELGVFKGNSIRWLANRYPQARIHGVDILPRQIEWPTSERIRYSQVDQADEGEVRRLFEDNEPPELILEDGSHVPSHQSRCLRLGWKALRRGGLYILEDIHTSHPDHPLSMANRPKPVSFWDRLRGRRPQEHSSLSLLLAFEHLKRRGRADLSNNEADHLAKGTHFGREDVREIFASIRSVHFYRRATLPSRCYSCGSAEYDYNAFRCNCGVELMSVADSMSVILVKE